MEVKNDKNNLIEVKKETNDFKDSSYEIYIKFKNIKKEYLGNTLIYNKHEKIGECSAKILEIINLYYNEKKNVIGNLIYKTEKLGYSVEIIEIKKELFNTLKQLVGIISFPANYGNKNDKKMAANLLKDINSQMTRLGISDQLDIQTPTGIRGWNILPTSKPQTILSFNIN